MATAPAPVSSASLYVGDLDRDVTEAQLYELFNQIGPVASIRVCRDAVTRRSLGYAYVNYNTSVDENAAVRALDELNYVVLNGRAIRIMWSQRDPSTRKNGAGNIFIKSLDENIDHKALHDTFSAFGNILSCKIAMSDGKSRGYGFVHFETEDAANLAIEKVNGMLLEGKKVFVGKFLKKNERESHQDQQVYTNVFVKNLDTEVTEEQLREKFSEIGTITKYAIMKDESGASKGFGFVNFEDPDDARKAVETLNDTLFGSKQIFVGRAQKKTEREAQLRQVYEERRQERFQKYQGVNLYIKNLDDSIGEEKLKEEFSNFGAITSVKIMQDDKGISRGFGFVCFSSPEEANRAVAEANGRMIAGKPIYVALAQRKEFRRQQLEQIYSTFQMPNPMLPPGTPIMRPVPGAMYPPNGAPMFYTGPPGILSGPAAVPQGQRQAGAPGMIYQQPQQQQVPRPWRPGPIQGQQIRPVYQPVQAYGGPMVNPRGQRQNRQRPIVQNQGQVQPLSQGPTAIPGVQPLPGQMGPPIQRNGRPQPYKYNPNTNGRIYNPQIIPQGPGVPNGMPVPVPLPVSGATANGPLPNGGVPLANGGPAIPGPLDILNPSVLAAAPPQQQKQLLGERLFPLIQHQQPELAGKITGMLLEMDNSELLLLLESPDSLTQKVEEAVIVLQQHGGAADEQQETPVAPESAEAVAAPPTSTLVEAV